MNIFFQLPLIFSWASFLFLVFLFIRSRNGLLDAASSRRFHWFVIAVFLVFQILFAAALTFLQYRTWAADPFTRTFLSFSIVPDSAQAHSFDFIYRFFRWPGGYFAYYFITHFWARVFLGFFAAFLWYWLLRFLRHYRSRFFEDDEVERGFACALVIGWPGIVLFIPTMFFLFVLHSLVRVLFQGKLYTPISPACLLALFIALATSGFIFHSGFLSVLSI